MEKAKSAVWEFFKICQDDEKRAECTLCPAETASSLKQIIRGKTRKNFSTTPLWNHLEGKHMKIFADAKSKNERSVDVVEAVEGPSNSAASSKTVQRGASRLQPTFDVTSKKKQMWSLDDSRSKELSKKICEMIALDAEAFSLVDREGFTRLIRHLAPQYPLPSRTYFSEKAMPAIYRKLEGRIKEKLSAVEHISLTADIWTDAMKTDSFFGLIAHCFSSEYIQRTTFVLGAKYLSTNHSGFNIEQVLSNLLEEWNISSDKVHVIVADGTANTTADPNITRVERVDCFIRSLDAVVHDAIFEQKSIIEILEKCRRIIHHSSHSALASAKLKKIHKNLKVPYQKLILDVPNRWASTLRMVAQLHEKKQAVATYAIESDIPALTALQWGTIESMIRVLKPFAEITKQASSDNETIAYVIPAVATLNSYLTKRGRDSRIHAMKSELQKSLNKRFSGSEEWNVQERKCFVLATLLDPRYKVRFLRDLEKAKNWIIDELVKARQNSILNQSQEEPLLSTEFQSCGIAEEAHEDIWQCFEEIAHGCKFEINDSFDGIDGSERFNPENFERQINDRSEEMAAIYRFELEEYLALPLLPREEDPLLWWKQHETRYPNIKKLMTKYLSPPPCSVNPRRLNAPATIYTENRNGLSPENAEKLIFLMRNMKIVNFVY